MKTILLTGFEPFGGAAVNPSWLAARRLHGRTIRGHRIVACRLPVEFGRSLSALQRQIEKVKPALVVCVGLAERRSEITPERLAVNRDDARIADNAGRKPADAPIVPGGPAAYRSTLPVRAIVRALRRRGIPARVSLDAGTYVCNHVFYGLMHALAQREQGAVRPRGGFIHVPPLSRPAVPQRGARQAKAGPAGLALKTMVQALAVAVRESLQPEPPGRQCLPPAARRRLQRDPLPNSAGASRRSAEPHWPGSLPFTCRATIPG
ncbi:MAG TPA: pyroglutamyl-peptidase I [Opitutaceae bacterium]|nr:pyroglutamyl-peptidase I [Opitutaceae bacterium]